MAVKCEVKLPTNSKYIGSREPDPFYGQPENIIREDIQNSMDALEKGQDEVHIDIEMRKVDINDIPGFDDFLKAGGYYEMACQQYPQNPKMKASTQRWLDNVEQIKAQGYAWALTFSDTGTTGLTKPYANPKNVRSILKSGWHALLSSFGQSVKGNSSSGFHGYGGKKAIEAGSDVAYAVRTLTEKGERAYTTRYIFPSSLSLKKKGLSATEGTIDENGRPRRDIADLDAVFGTNRTDAGTDIAMFSANPLFADADEFFDTVCYAVLDAYPFAISEKNLSLSLAWGTDTLVIDETTLFGEVKDRYYSFYARKLAADSSFQVEFDAYTALDVFYNTDDGALEYLSGTDRDGCHSSIILLYRLKCDPKDSGKGSYVPIFRGQDARAFHIDDMKSNIVPAEAKVLGFLKLTEPDETALQDNGEDLSHKKLAPSNPVTKKIRKAMNTGLREIFEKKDEDQLVLVGLDQLLGGLDEDAAEKDENPNRAKGFADKDVRRKRKKIENSFEQDGDEEELGTGDIPLNPPPKVTEEDEEEEDVPEPEDDDNDEDEDVPDDPKPEDEKNEDENDDDEDKDGNDPDNPHLPANGENIETVPKMTLSKPDCKLVSMPAGKLLYMPKKSGKVAIGAVVSVSGQKPTSTDAEHVPIVSAYDRSVPNSTDNLADGMRIVMDVEANKRYELTVNLGIPRPKAMEALVWRYDNV